MPGSTPEEQEVLHARDYVRSGQLISFTLQARALGEDFLSMIQLWFPFRFPAVGHLASHLCGPGIHLLRSIRFTLAADLPWSPSEMGSGSTRSQENSKPVSMCCTGACSRARGSPDSVASAFCIISVTATAGRAVEVRSKPQRSLVRLVPG